MRAKTLLVGTATFFGVLALGFIFQVAVFGPQRLLRSPLTGWAIERFLDGRDGTIQIGAAMPVVQLPDLAGQQQVLPKLGRATLVNYWATWCGPCIGEMPLLNQFAGDNTSGVEVVGVAQDEPVLVRAFLAQRPVRFSILMEAPTSTDSSTRMGNRRNILPFSVLVNARGRVVARRYGAFQDADDLREWAAKAK